MSAMTLTEKILAKHAGRLTITASAPGLRSATLTLPVHNARNVSRARLAAALLGRG